MMSKQCIRSLSDDSVLLCGYYKKLKTMKKKFFVLYNKNSCKVARIEYFDNEKKFRSGFTPKRIIKIKNCFSINRRLYTKHDYVIVLACKEGGFGIVMDSEDEMNTWMSHLLHLQRSGENCFGVSKFDSVWQVIIQKKGIAEQHNIFGSHHICLGNKSITFIKIKREKNDGEQQIKKIEVLLTTVRRCGDSHCYFYMEIGRQSPLGPGELWMETEDSLTAQNMHKMILSKMASLKEELIEPMRKRSSSATESTNLYHEKKLSQNTDATNTYLLAAQNCSRDRCDSLPSRNRTASETSDQIQTIYTRSCSRVFNDTNTTDKTCSASEELVGVQDFEQFSGTLYLKRSPKGVIPEECVSEGSSYRDAKNSGDMSSVITSSIGNLAKAHNLPILRQYDALNNQLSLNPPKCYSGCVCESDISKETFASRVRAFSVGSRIKGSRISSRANYKLFSTDCDTYSARKSISVPVLINKNFHPNNRMSDLMELDFSKTINIHLTQDNNESPNTFTLIPGNTNILNSAERNIKSCDSGYLEMKPIIFDPKSAIDTLNDCLKKPTTYIKPDTNFESAASIELMNDGKNFGNPKTSNYINIKDKHGCQSNKDCNILSITQIPAFFQTSSKTHYDIIKLNEDEPSVNKDLYYASLDLPKCGNEVCNRYGLQEIPREVNWEEIKNEYAKINFVQPEGSRSSTKKKF